jgi:hypothetical protein
MIVAGRGPLAAGRHLAPRAPAGEAIRKNAGRGHPATQAQPVCAAPPARLIHGGIAVARAALNFM